MNNARKSCPTAEPDVTCAVQSLRALSHPLRLKILCVLSGPEMTAGAILERVGTSQSNVSQHLRRMLDSDLLTTRRDGNLVFYRLGNPKLLPLIEMLDDLYGLHCA